MPSAAAVPLAWTVRAVRPAAARRNWWHGQLGERRRISERSWRRERRRKLGSGGDRLARAAHPAEGPRAAARCSGGAAASRPVPTLVGAAASLASQGTTETNWASSCPTTPEACTPRNLDGETHGSDGHPLRYESEHFALYWHTSDPDSGGPCSVC